MVLLVAGAAYGLWRARTGADAFRAWPFGIALAVLDVQVLLGIVLWMDRDGWTLGLLQGWLHPLLALAALGAGHTGMAVARGQATTPTLAFRSAGLGLIAALLLVVGVVITAFAG